MKSTRLAAIVLIGCVAPQPFPAQQNSAKLWSFERAEELQSVRTSHARVSRQGQLAADGQNALRIDFEPAAQPQVEFSAASVRTDWRPFGALAIHAANPSGEPIGFSMEVEDASGQKTTAHTPLELRPKETQDYAFALNSPPPVEMGMRGEPPIPGFRLLAEDHHAVDLAHVAKIRIFLDKPAGPRSLVIDDVRLAPGVSYDKIVDRFGQYARESWPGKLLDEAQFHKERAEEEAELKARPSLPDRDEYGGWATGPQLEATGYFRTARDGGKWWLVTPRGHLFFSLGFNAINASEGGTVVEGREQMFEWLPAAGDPLAKFYGSTRDSSPVGLTIQRAHGKTFQFYDANLERKYGPDWREKWKAVTLARLPAWGFNTIANWSDPSMYDARRVPYTATLEIDGDFAEVPSGNDYWKHMSDPFDPRFAEAAKRSARAAEKHRDDPWCLGYFVDNELSWGTMKDEKGRYGLALGALSLKGDSPAKQAFVHELEQRYGSVGKLNAAWGTAIGGWRELLDQPFHAAETLSPAMQQDLGRFVKHFAEHYFQTVRTALREYDPNHLYLGSRFAWYTQETVEACAEFCDVISLNIYRPRVEHSQWSFLDALNKPALVGEFHMGAVDRGMFHTGLVKTRDQAERAAMFTDYVQSVIDNPVFVGCHYFKYADEPLTGRPGDGENYSIGFTTVVDTPYREMIEAARAVSAEMYTRRMRQAQ